MAITRRDSGKVEYEGLVVAKGLHGMNFNDGCEYGIDAEVWDPDLRFVRRVGTGSTMATEQYPNDEVVVDASDEVKALAEAYDAREARKATLQYHIFRARRPAVGRQVQVVAGRKVPHGTEGQVFYVGRDKFNRHAWRVGFRTAQGEALFTADVNVKVLNPDLQAMEDEWAALSAADGGR